MPFEVFKRQMAPLAKKPYLTIQRRGNLSLNASAHSVLNGATAVELLFDRENRQIGIRPTDESTEHAYAVRPLGKAGSSWLISALAFTEYYNIPIEVARRYPAEVHDNMLVVDLNGPSTEIVSNRHRGKGALQVSTPAQPEQ